MNLEIFQNLFSDIHIFFLVKVFNKVMDITFCTSKMVYLLSKTLWQKNCVYQRTNIDTSLVYRRLCWLCILTFRSEHIFFPGPISISQPEIHLYLPSCWNFTLFTTYFVGFLFFFLISWVKFGPVHF